MKPIEFCYELSGQDIERLLKVAALKWGITDPSFTLSFDQTTSRVSANLAFRRSLERGSVRLSPEAFSMR